MKVLVDMSVVHGPEVMRTGLAQYGLRILAGFDAYGYKDIYILAVKEVAGILREQFPSFQIIPYSLVGNPFLNSIRWRRMVKRTPVDIVLRVAQIPKYNFWKVNKPVVITLHDLNVFHESDIPLLYKWTITRALRNATRIIAITQFVKDDVLRFIPGVSAEKVQVIHNGITPPVYHNVSLPFQEPFILTVNSLIPSKNIMTLIRAFSFIKKRIPHKLVVIGKETEYFKTVMRPFIETNGMEERVIVIPFASDDLLYSLYGATDLFVTTSLLEGFGATPIEAALMGAPVLSTRETALPESTMGLVNYYEPATDDRVLATRILEVLAQDDSKELPVIAETFRTHYDYIDRAKDVYVFLEEVTNKANR